jgi:4'-phosphopantetheinyl transferase
LAAARPERATSTIERQGDDPAATPIARALAMTPPSGDVALWWCSLDLSAAEAARRIEWLSDAERARMLRFGTEALRQRYLAGRSALRRVLADALGVAPAAVPIVRGARGRPRLDGDATVDFNLSHTGNVALVGVARRCRIGVDVERADRIVNAAGIARRFLTASERAALPDASDDACRARVLRLWTCKEALAKATGEALSAPFARIEVALEPALRLADGPAPYRPADWTLHRAGTPDAWFGTVALWRFNNAGA